MLVRAHIQKWGNSLALRITGPVRAIPNFKAGMAVDIEVSEDGILVRSASQQRGALPFSEADLLKGLTPQKAHADEVADFLAGEMGE
jgi:antitoxin MazE